MFNISDTISFQYRNVNTNLYAFLLTNLKTDFLCVITALREIVFKQEWFFILGLTSILDSYFRMEAVYSKKLHDWRLTNPDPA